jgi:hypothetical protein
MKLCKDCRFAGPPGAPPNKWICAHPAAVFRRTSPVTGEHLADAMYCNMNRQVGPCGMDAKHWEALDTPPAGFV